MPLVKDGEITEGFLRDRKVLKFLLEPEEDVGSIDRVQSTEETDSPHPMAEKYAEQMADVLDLSVEEVKDSEPYRNYVKRLRGE